MGFENLIGNEKVKELLIQIIKTNRLSHSYMFIGPSGIGKTLFAKEFAKMILCQNQSEKCDNCKSCIEFQDNNNPDFLLLEPDDGKIKIEQIRGLQKTILEKPIISNKKVYIIKDADTMTKEAGNSLLKTLEEPPKYLTIILIGTNEGMFLNTIKSRCTKILFNKIEDDKLKIFLEKEHNMKDIKNSMLKTFDGSIEKALIINSKIDIYNKIEEVFNNIENMNLITAMNQLKCMYEEKESIYEILDYINIILFNKAKNNTQYIKYIQYVEQTKTALRNNANYDMSIDNLLYSIYGANMHESKGE